MVVSPIFISAIYIIGDRRGVGTSQSVYVGASTWYQRFVMEDIKWVRAIGCGLGPPPVADPPRYNTIFLLYICIYIYMVCDSCGGFDRGYGR